MRFLIRGKSPTILISLFSKGAKIQGRIVFNYATIALIGLSTKGIARNRALEDFGIPQWFLSRVEPFSKLK